MFFRRNNNRRRDGEESKGQLIELTPNLFAQVWTAKNRDGTVRCHWALRRRAEDGGNPYVSMRIETLAEIPAALTALSLAFSQADGLPEDVRVDCGAFSALMQKVTDLQHANGPLAESKKPERGLLNLA